MHCLFRQREWEKRHGLFSKPLGELLRREVTSWAIVQKDMAGPSCFSVMLYIDTLVWIVCSLLLLLNFDRLRNYA